MSMSRTTRFWIYLLAFAMVGFWLNVFAILVVASTNGLAGVPAPLLQLVYVAYWPSWLCGVPHENFFHPDLLKPLIMNVTGWTVLGGLASLVHHSVARTRTSAAL